jgi:hypothetical protein
MRIGYPVQALKHMISIKVEDTPATRLETVTGCEADVQLYLDFMQAHYPGCVWTWNPDTKPPETGVLLIILKGIVTSTT